jgi:hypothetical protein
MGGNSTLSHFQGFCNHKVEPRTQCFDGLIAQDQEVTHRFLVDDINVPLTFCIDWQDDMDSIYPDVYDPDNEEIDISLEGHYSESVYTINAWRPGVYTIVLNGVRIESQAQVRYNASANYPFYTGKAPGGGEDGDAGTGWLATGVIGLALASVVAIILFVIVRSGRFPRGTPVEEDYSYPVSAARTPPRPPARPSSRGRPPPSTAQHPGGQVPPWADPRQEEAAPRAVPRPPPPAREGRGSQVQGIGTGMPPPAPGETRCVSCGRSFEAGTTVCPYCGLPR